MKTYILDSFALLCLFDGNRPKEKEIVKNYLEQAEDGKISLYMSKINEGEIYYKLYKYIGSIFAAGFRSDIKKACFL